MANTRIHYLRKHTYKTRSYRIRKIRTPGGRLTVQYMKKTSKGPQASFGSKARLSGLRQLSNQDNSKANRSSRRVARAYGGVITPSELKERIMRAFLIEEVKVVKRIVKESKMEKKVADKKPADQKKAAEKKPVAKTQAPAQQKTQKPKGK